MYERIAIDIIEELAKRTVFSKAALEKQDEQETARKAERSLRAVLSKLQPKVDSQHPTWDNPTFGKRLTESTFNK